jgi:hypothetical protein
VGRVALSESDAWFNLGENPCPLREGSRSNRRDDGSGNKIAGVAGPDLNATPPESGWFNLKGDPNGI